ncbi:hypothetical protein SLEP1_g15060 [Rubroshorea leprosula]|uniref:Uncharacterized protein n=1 Tax=Rubroshorea leprosula TaxID=152421 RepID=A0AAV5IS33_9ROSI|nr:hypothetical protein SLEP1_g15060 [Rubroshorea leprosula]
MLLGSLLKNLSAGFAFKAELFAICYLEMVVTNMEQRLLNGYCQQ